MAQSFQIKNKCSHGTIINRPYINKHSHNIKQNQNEHSFRKQSLTPMKTISNHISSHHNNYISKQGYKPSCYQCSSPQYHNNKSKQSKYYLQIDHSGSELMKVLIDQNSNLKDQNMYLQRQLNKYILKQKEHNETILEYESIMSILNSQNTRLHKQILELSDNANCKVDKLKSTISKFFKNHKMYPQNQAEKEDIEEQDQKMFQHYNQNEQDMRYKKMRKNRSEKAFMNVGRMFKAESKCPSMYINPIKNDQYVFEELLEECRKQNDPNKRKQIRRKMIELTYKD